MEQSDIGHDSRTLISIFLIVLLTILDALFTLDLVRKGATELNPVMAFYLNYSPVAFFGVKYLLTSASIFLILANKNVYLFNTRIQAKSLCVLFAVFLTLTVQWEIYLIITS